MVIFSDNFATAHAYRPPGVLLRDVLCVLSRATVSAVFCLAVLLVTALSCVSEMSLTCKLNE